ncbi:MAG: CRTAC1 family protein, partial [Terriglobales bacterium]
DYDHDGLLDLTVTNFSHDYNTVFRNQSRPRAAGGMRPAFEDVTVRTGVNLPTFTSLCWTADAADVDGDGRPDLFVTNIDFEPNNLFHNNGDETFDDVTVQARLGSVAQMFSGFGTRFVDYDNDGNLDIFVLNGHPMDNVQLMREGVTPAERPFLLENTGGARFEEVGAQHGEALTRQYHGRGLAMGDFDNDGDEDFLIVQNGGPPVLLRNDGGNRNAWVGFELVGLASGKEAVGAVVTVTAGSHRQVQDRVGGASYLSASDSRLLFGLGAAEKIDKVEVRWPSGAMSELENLSARRYYRIEEPEGKKGPRG